MADAQHPQSISYSPFSPIFRLLFILRNVFDNGTINWGSGFACPFWVLGLFSPGAWACSLLCLSMYSHHRTSYLYSPQGPPQNKDTLLNCLPPALFPKGMPTKEEACQLIKNTSLSISLSSQLYLRHLQRVVN